MSVGLKASISAPLSRMGEDAREDMARAVTVGLRAVAAGVKQDLRREIMQAFDSNRFPNAIDARAYPDRPNRYSGSAAVSIWPRGRRAELLLDAFSEPTVITARNRKVLAVPLPGVPRDGRGRALTPAQWEARFGEGSLRFVPRRKANGLVGVLVSQAVTLGGGKRARFRKARRKEGVAGPFRSEPVYALMRQVALKQRLSPEKIVEDWANRAGDFIGRAADAAER